MKYLVTGGAGFIGSNFIRLVLKKYPDAHVVNLDKLTYAGNQDNLSDLAKDSRYTFVKGDIADLDTVTSLAADCDVIVNFAAETHVDRSITGPADFVRTNVLGTQVLLEAAAKHKRRFHHISTDEVFGSLSLEGSDKFNENTGYDPRSPYSASKASSDHLVRAYYHTFDLPATISNCSNNYGPYQHPEKLIPLMAINALRGEDLPVYGDGLNVRDWIHVDDHCEAIDLIINKGKVGETYLVGGNAEKPNIEIVKMILKHLGQSEDKIKFVPDRLGHDRRYAIDSSRIESELGFTRKYDFESGLVQTVEWYKNNPQWWQKLMKSGFNEYYKKQYQGHD
jgi:dTDP-glucose 4,6-dehydratase